MIKDHINRRNRREVARQDEPDAKIVVAGTMVYTPPQPVNPEDSSEDEQSPAI